MAYNYVATCQRPTGVTHAFTAAFTGPEELNLVIVKSSRLEVHALGPEGLVPVFETKLYGRVAVARAVRPQHEQQDLLFVATERCQFTLLGYDREAKSLKTRASGSLRESIGRSVEGPPLGVVDPLGRMVALHLYEGALKIVPFTPTGRVNDPFSVRLEEANVLDLCFLHGYTGKPTLAVLYADQRGARHVKTYAIATRDREATPGPWSQLNVERGANLLIPVPDPLGGVVIVGSQTLTYHSGRSFKAIPVHTTCICAYGAVDADGSRFLLGDTQGQLSLLALNHDGREVRSLHLEVLGETSCASALAYLDSGVLFVGSASGDSQLVRLNTERDEAGSYLSVEASYTSLAPILDMCLLEPTAEGSGGSKQGPAQLVTCSGTYKDGSLRVVRNGIGITEQAAIDLPGIKGLWSLRPATAAPYDKYLVQAFTSETRILGIEGEEMEEVSIPGFAPGKTLFASNMASDTILQVTEAGCRLLDATTADLASVLSEWKPAQGSRVTVAGGNGTQVVLALNGGELVCLELNQGQRALEEKARRTLEYEVSCLSAHPLNPHTNTEDEEGDRMDEETQPTPPSSSPLVAVGMWTDMSVRLLALPSLEQVASCALGGDTQARSVLLTTLESRDYLLVGLGDGHLVSYPLQMPASAADITSSSSSLPTLGARKRVALGTQPISLTPFRSHGSACVFAASDRPTVIHAGGSGDKLLFANVNTAEVTLMAPFHSELFPECLALASEAGLRIGTVDDIQRLQVTTIPLGESPRRICHAPHARVVAVLTAKYALGEAGEEEANWVRFLDDSTFEPVGHFELRPMEMACSIARCSLSKDPRELIIVGTCMAVEDEEEPKEGRILVFHVSEPSAASGAAPAVEGMEVSSAVVGAGGREIQLVAEKGTKGAVYCLQAFNGKLLAGINSKVQLYRWAEKDGAPELQTECGHHGHIMALYMQSRGDFIVVGDLIRSISLLVYKPIDGTIEEIAKDYSPHWMTAVDMLDEETYIGSEHQYNIFTVRKNSGAATDEERYRLETVGEFHLGEFVNKFVHGSLVLQPSDAPSAQPTTTEPTATTAADEEEEEEGEGGEKAGGAAGAAARAAAASLLFGTVNGMIGAVLPLAEGDYRFFHALSKALNKVVKGAGGLEHGDWRRFVTDKQVAEAHGFVDGDLVEVFVDLPRPQQEEVVAILQADGITGSITSTATTAATSSSSDAMDEDKKASGAAGQGGQGGQGAPLTVEEVYRRVEEMARLH